MIRLLKEKAAGEIIVGDQSGVEHVMYFGPLGFGSSRECCRAAGLLQVIDEYGATPCFFEEKGYDAYRATYPEGSHNWQKPIQLTTAIDDVDHIINLPRVGSHKMAGESFALKLAVGFLRDDSRMYFHMRRGILGDADAGDWQRMYEEINQVPELLSKVRLTVTSGRGLMTTGGPDEGEVVWPDYGLVFASHDLLTSDLLAASWLQVNRAGEEPSNIYSNPAIVNRIARMGGCPELIRWIRVNENPDASLTAHMEDLLEARNCHR
jgi:uncharacterized protein (DUF362 family)